MELIHVIILGIIEGVTEFLPVSSTGHLILTSDFFHITDQEFLNTFNIFIQIGAISSILKIYFREILERKKWLLELFVGFLPVAFFGFFFGGKIRELLFNSLTVCIMLILGGFFLIYLDRFYEKKKEFKKVLNYKDHLMIGLFQCLAIIPGFSRSTSCLVGGMFTNVDKKESIKVTFLYGLPALYAASFYSLLKLDFKRVTGEEIWFLLLGTIISFITSYFTVKIFLKFLERKVFSGFGYYRILLALVILSLNYFIS